MKRRSKVYSLSDAEFKQLVANSTSVSQCLNKLNLSTNGGSSFDLIKQRIKELDCDTAHFERSGASINANNHSLEEILIKDSKYKNIPYLKKRLVKSGIFEYKCAICGISTWNGAEIALQLDHINGDNSDNRLENLRLICPNCHSQTDTYAGKNKKK